MPISRSDLVSAVESEKLVLGSALLGRGLPQTALASDDFSLDSHRRIYGAMRRLQERDIPIDAFTLQSELEVVHDIDRVGGSAYISSLTDCLPLTLNIEHHACVIVGKATRRRFIAKLEALQAQAGDGAELCELAARIPELEECLRDGQMSGIRNLADIPSLFELDLPEPCFAVPQVLPYQRVTVIAGQSGSGKTYLMLKMAIACATGGRFLGRECMQMPVLILDRENAGSEMRERIHKIAGGDVPGIRIWGDWVEKEGPPDLDDPRLLKWAKQCQPLIIVDSLIDFLEGDEQSSVDIGKLFRPAHRLKNSGATVVIIHHVSDKLGAALYRGSSGIKAEADLLTILSRDRESSLLKLDQAKLRGGAEISIAIRADFSTAEFEQTDSIIAEQKRDDAADILEVLEAQPGMTANQIRKLIRKRLENVTPILVANTGKLWRTENTGRGGATCYFPMSISPTSPISPEHRGKVS